MSAMDTTIIVGVIFAGGPVRPRSVAGIAMEMFEQHQGTHILQVRCLYMMQ